MEVRCITIYKLFGIASLPGGVTTVSFVHLPAFNASATLTSDADAYCFHIDRIQALSIQMTKALVGQAGHGTIQERLAAEIEAVRERRRQRTGSGFFLVIEATSDIPSPDLAACRDCGDFSVCFDAYDRIEILDRFRKPIDAVLAAIALALTDGKDARIEKVGSASYLVDSDTRSIVYSFTGKIRASMSAAGPLSGDDIESIRRHAETFCVEQALVKIAPLLVRSLDTVSDRLYAFIAVWAALEIFVNASFKEVYGNHWYGVLCSGTPETARKYFERVRSVMKDKHRLVDKFMVIAAILSGDMCDQDVRDFNRLKKCRDSLLHGEMVDVIHLPVEETQRLLRRYLKLHLERNLN